MADEPLQSMVARAATKVERVGGDQWVLRADRLIDGTGAPPIENASVLIDDRRVVFAGPTAAAPPTPSGAKVREFPGATLLPGMIDAHVHLTGNLTHDVYRRYLSPEMRERPIIAALHAAVMLGAGFTTVRDIGTGQGSAIRDAVAAGIIDGPRVLTAVAAIGQTGGHADWHLFPHEWISSGPYPRGYLADGVDECRRVVRRVLRDRADVIKLHLESGGVTNTPEDLHNAAEFTDDELRVLIDEPHRRGIRVAAHAKSRDVIRRAVEFGIDTIEHADLDPRDTDVFELMADRGVVLVPTLSLYHWVSTEGERWGVFEQGRRAAAEVLPRRQAMVHAAVAAGVRVAVGTDTGSAMALGKNAMEVSLLAQAGLSPLAAIEAATRVAAEALGLEDLIGTLEPGKMADVMVVDGDPSESVEHLLDDRNPVRVFSTAWGAT